MIKIITASLGFVFTSLTFNLNAHEIELGLINYASLDKSANGAFFNVELETSLDNLVVNGYLEDSDAIGSLYKLTSKYKPSYNNDEILMLYALGGLYRIDNKSYDGKIGSTAGLGFEAKLGSDKLLFSYEYNHYWGGAVSRAYGSNQEYKTNITYYYSAWFIKGGYNHFSNNKHFNISLGFKF